LIGYFEGRKVLRLGDPLSPYLFVLVIEVFSNLMEDYARMNTDFQFHHRCAKLRLSHLCFVDDLLIFLEASLKSVNVIQQVLKEFECLSGLKANPSKSSIFFAGVSERI
jgi:hypothetical protein